MSPTRNNPYAQAAGKYDQNARQNAGSQREQEGRILLKANRMLKDLQAHWENMTREVLEETLKYNRQIWMLFYDTALENPEGNRPNDLRSNIINLANFIFKREMDILGDPKREKIDILITINQEVAAGLMTKQAGSEEHAAPGSGGQAPSSPPPAASGSSTDVHG
ncbi:MAG: flagellar FlaF family protein [Alphaproteobacteria bacterium]|nr:flagellar FlaF family protein [Alphaproteobacteria bacterium]